MSAFHGKVGKGAMKAQRVAFVMHLTAYPLKTIRIFLESRRERLEANRG